MGGRERSRGEKFVWILCFNQRSGRCVFINIFARGKRWALLASPLVECLPLLSGSAEWEAEAVSVSGTGGRGLFFLLLASCSELVERS